MLTAMVFLALVVFLGTLALACSMAYTRISDGSYSVIGLIITVVLCVLHLVIVWVGHLALNDALPTFVPRAFQAPLELSGIIALLLWWGVWPFTAGMLIAPPVAWLLLKMGARHKVT